MIGRSPAPVVLDPAGTLAFASNGASSGVRVAHPAVVGVVPPGVITAVGGGAVVRPLLAGLRSAMPDAPHAAHGSLVDHFGAVRDGLDRAASRSVQAR